MSKVENGPLKIATHLAIGMCACAVCLSYLAEGLGRVLNRDNIIAFNEQSDQAAEYSPVLVDLDRGIRVLTKNRLYPKSQIFWIADDTIGFLFDQNQTLKYMQLNIFTGETSVLQELPHAPLISQMSQDGKKIYYVEPNQKGYSLAVGEVSSFNIATSFVDPNQHELAVSADGKHLAFTVNGRFGPHIKLEAVNDFTELPLEFTGSSYDPTFSPDGQSLVFVGRMPDWNYTELFTYNLHDENTQQFTHLNGMIASPNWSNDGQHLVAILNGDIVLLDNQANLVTQFSAENGLSFSRPALKPS